MRNCAKPACILLALTVATSCDLFSEPDRTGITLEPDSVELMVGDTAWLTATVLGKDGEPDAAGMVGWDRTSENIYAITVGGDPLDPAGSRLGHVRAAGPGGVWAVAEAPSGARDSAWITVHGYDVSFESVSAGSFSCGLTAEGQPYCWGLQIELLPFPDGFIGVNFYTAPKPVANAPVFANIQVGHVFACGLTGAGEAYCWGDDEYGTLGRGPSPWRWAQEPQPVATDLSFRSLAVGSVHTCGLTADGAAYCWGYHLYGQLGIGEPVDECAGWPCSRVPVPVAGAHRFRSIAAGGYHTCATTEAGATYCWGLNNQHQLGVESAPDICQDFFFDQPCARTPIPAATALVFDTLVAGGGHTCGLSDASAFCWGQNYTGGLGTGEESVSRVSPGAVSGDHRFVTLTAGGEHTCGQVASGETYCWGYNAYGQLGTSGSESCLYNGTIFECLRTPTRVAGNFAFLTVSAGNVHNCGMTTARGPFCWGSNGGGNLGVGDGLILESAVPLPVYGASP